MATPKRKDPIVKNALADMLTKIEGGKSQISVGDMRQARKLLVVLEAAFINSGYKSAVLQIRKDAVVLAAKNKLKEAKLKAKAKKK